MQFKLSKKQWQFIGRKAGWMKITALNNNVLENLQNEFLGHRFAHPIAQKDSGEIIIPQNTKITNSMLLKLMQEWPNVDMWVGPVSIKIDEIMGNSGENKPSEPSFGEQMDDSGMDFPE